MQHRGEREGAINKTTEVTHRGNEDPSRDYISGIACKSMQQKPSFQVHRTSDIHTFALVVVIFIDSKDFYLPVRLFSSCAVFLLGDGASMVFPLSWLSSSRCIFTKDQTPVPWNLSVFPIPYCTRS